MTNSRVNFSFLAIIALFLPILVISRRTEPHFSDPCHRPPDPRALRSDQMTVLMNGYSERRIPLLRRIASTYATSASVASVLILWSNPSTAPSTLSQLSRNLSLFSASATPITVLRQRSTSLNSRFNPQKSIKTRAVLICDDDVEPDPESINFAFSIWQSNPDHLVGFFARSHDYDLPTKSWIYTMRRDKYSIILTKFMILKLEYLYKYSCDDTYGSYKSKARAIVDDWNNCEDILMNFLVADEVKAGPTLVGAKRVRDWGDARNEGVKEMKEVGLSSRTSGEHRKRRGECIREFHRVMGRMPLKYSYGKVIDSVGEQGLCEKGGNLVYCDQQLLI